MATAIKNPIKNGTTKVDFTFITKDAPVLTTAIANLILLYMHIENMKNDPATAQQAYAIFWLFY